MDNYSRMLPFFCKQFNAYSCSVASVAIVINTIMAGLSKNDTFDPIHQHELLQKVDVINWRKKVSLQGFEGEHGLTIAELGTVVETALNAYKVPFKKLSTVSIHKNLKNLDKEKDRLHFLMTKHCKDPNHFMIAHFTQGVYTGDWYGGHISPVACFDPVESKAFILDVDQDTESPYWVSFDLFFEGLVGEKKTTGPEGGGYVNVFV